MCISRIIYSRSIANCDSRITARFLHVRHRRQLPLPRDHPALQGITRSAYPAGFPLDDRLHQASGVEVGTPTTDTFRHNTTTIPDVQKNHTTSSLSQPIQEDAPQFTVPGVTVARAAPTSSRPNSILPLRPVPAVSVVGLGGENSGIPQIFLVNQPLEGGSRFTPALVAGSGSTQLQGFLHLPTYPVGSVRQSLDVDSAPNAGLPMWSADRKTFTRRKNSRNILRKSDKGKGKRS